MSEINELPHSGLGEQYDGDNIFTGRMRRHQSWWRVTQIGCSECGTALNGNDYGNYLPAAAASAGKNFLNNTIWEVAQERMKSGNGVEKFRFTSNLLSSQPMAFNLFAPLHADPVLAARLLDPLLPGGVVKARVLMEWAPPPKNHLNDRTSLDVAVFYTDRSGVACFAGIETKLTEPFSRKSYVQTEAYRAVGEKSSVWNDANDPALSNTKWNQLWRNHLLVESVCQSGGVQDFPEPCLRGCLVAVLHDCDSNGRRIAEEYGRFLSAPDQSFRLLTLGAIIAMWQPLVDNPEHIAWLADFRLRYLELDKSGS